MTFMTRLTLPIRWEGASKENAKRARALLLALGLTGCGGGDEGGSGGGDSPLPPSPAEQVQVVDGFSVAKPNERTQLDLSAFVRGRGATLTSLTSEQPECGAGSVSGLTAEVNISDTTLCQYRFSARSSGSAEGVATLSVLATLAATPVLEPLSAAMTLSDTAKAFDVVALYGASLPAGYNLKAGSVVVQGGTVQGAATQSGNVITYTQPGAADWNRVLFTLEDPTKPGEDILGTLYITVSETANQAPTISNAKYDYSAPGNANAGTNYPIVTFQQVTLDLANLKNLTIKDPDTVTATPPSGEWQLIEVQSYSASVASAFPSDTSNKKFTFQAGTVGQHIVSYIVGDHEGGYRMGQMSITVGPKEQAKDWANIDLVTPGLRFYAPPLFSEIKSGVSPEFVIEPVWDAAANGGTGNTIGAVGNLAATAYCSGKRLPKQADLDTLRSATGMPASELAKYPKARPYLISDAAGTTFQTYNLTDGSVAAYMTGTTPNPYVVCVGDHGLSYIATPNTPYVGMANTVVSDGTWQTIGTVNSGGGTTGASPTLFGTPTNAGPGSLGVGNFRLTPGSCAGGTCTLDAKGASDEYGTATAQIANAVMTSNTFNVPTTFLQNAQVTAASATTDSAKADGADANIITLILKDKAGNAVPSGTPVTLSYSTSTTPAFTPNITPASGASVNVNASGQVAINIKSNTVGAVTLTNPMVVGGLPLSATSTTATFVTPNAAPIATVSISTPITASEGEPFIANWTYFDAESDPESGSTVEWFSNGISAGPATVIASGTNPIFYPPDGFGNTTITVKITPKSSAGVSVGSAVVSTGVAVINKTWTVNYLFPIGKNNSGASYSQNASINYCAALNTGGVTGYRLPSISEYKTLYAQMTGNSPGTGSTAVCLVHGWPSFTVGGCNGAAATFWTNDTSGGNGYDIQMFTGNESVSNNLNPRNLTCVR